MRKLERVYSYVGPASSSVAVKHHSNFISTHCTHCMVRSWTVSSRACCVRLHECSSSSTCHKASRLPARISWKFKFHMPQVLYLSPESGVSLSKVCFAIGGFLCGVWISSVLNEILRWCESELWFITYYSKTSLIRNQLIQTLR